MMVQDQIAIPPILKCVSDEFHPLLEQFAETPKMGEIYEVRKVVHNFNGTKGVLLEGVHNEPIAQSVVMLPASKEGSRYVIEDPEIWDMYIEPNFSLHHFEGV